MFKKILFSSLVMFAASFAYAEELTLATENTYPPFEFIDTSKGNTETVGFDIDLARLLGQKAGFTVKIVPMGFDAIVPAILGRQVDMAASAITITPERAHRVDFSAPYYESGISILVRSADKEKYQTAKSLKNKVICAQIGTSGADYGKKVAGAQVKAFNTMNEAYLELRNFGCDAVLGDRPTIGYFLASNPKNQKVFFQQHKVLNVEKFGIMVSKKNTKLLKRLNKALKEAKKDGSYQALMTKWFAQ